MKKKYVVILLLLVFSCKSQKEQVSEKTHDSSLVVVQVDSSNFDNEPFFTDSINSELFDVRGIHKVFHKINQGLPEYMFVLYGDSEHNCIYQIDIYKVGDSSLVQSIQTSMDEPPPKFLSIFDFKDINLDGYQDMKLLNYWGATGNYNYSYWLFDPKTGFFKYNEQLSQLVNPEVDSQTKQLSSIGYGGMAGHIYGMQTYIFQGDSLILVRSEVQEYYALDSVFHKTIRVRENGVMIDSAIIDIKYAD